MQFADDDEADEEVYQFWIALGASGEWTEKLVECNPRWVGCELLVRCQMRGKSDWLERLCRIMWYFPKFSKFSDSRWCSLGKSCRTLVCGWIVGLDQFVAWLLKTKSVSEHYLGGYGRINLQLKRFCVVTALAGYVPDSFLALLMEDDRVCLHLESFKSVMQEELGFLDELSDFT